MTQHTNAKAMAKYLRAALADQNISLSHSSSLEIIAKQLGFADWNTLSAKLPSNGEIKVLVNEVDAKPISQKTEVVEPWSACSFCGKSRREVRSLVGGCGGWDAFRASRGPERSNVFICDECATLTAGHFAQVFSATPETSTN